jgi:hypothetical protein
MLSRRYELHDVDDVEALCEHVANLWARRTQTRLSPADHEDLVAFLIAEAWRLGERFRPTAATAKFRSYAMSLLPYRATDWLRQSPSGSGRTRWTFATNSYERPVVHTLSLDAPLADDHEGTLRDTVSDLSADPAGDRGEALDWLFAVASREAERDLHRLRDEHARRTRERTRNAADRKRRQRVMEARRLDPDADAATIAAATRIGRDLCERVLGDLTAEAAHEHA